MGRRFVTGVASGLQNQWTVERSSVGSTPIRLRQSANSVWNPCKDFLYRVLIFYNPRSGMVPRARKVQGSYEDIMEIQCGGRNIADL